MLILEQSRREMLILEQSRPNVHRGSYGLHVICLFRCITFSLLLTQWHQFSVHKQGAAAMSAIRATQDILRGAVFDPDLSTSTFRIYRKPGGFLQARKDFELLKPSNFRLSKVVIEPRREKIGFLHMRKPKRRSASR